MEEEQTKNVVVEEHKVVRRCFFCLDPEFLRGKEITVKDEGKSITTLLLFCPKCGSKL
jgi:Zn finger protein HypA/HybF involved in hydrogenase expression